MSIAVKRNSTGTSFDQQELYFFHQGGTRTAPRTSIFHAGMKDSTCGPEVCFAFAQGCTQGQQLTCTKLFIPTAGSATVSFASRSETDGGMIGSVSNIRMVEWNTSADAPVPNGQCYTLSSSTFNVSW